MKKFDLNAYGVEEMCESQTREVNGGWWQFVVTYIIIEAALNPNAHINAFMEGYNSVK